MDSLINKIGSEALSQLEESRKSKQGIEGISRPKISEEQRQQRQIQDSTNRRFFREAKRAAITGRTTNWLKNYASKKDAEFNAQNAIIQQTVTPSASVTYTKTSDSPETNLVTKQNNNGAAFGGGGGGGARIFIGGGGGGGGGGSSGNAVGLGAL